MTIEQLQNLTMDDINRMSLDELQGALKYGKKVLLKRYKSQKSKLGEVAPVFKSTNPYRIKTTNLTRGQMVNRLIKVQQTTKAVTTTITGYKKWKKRQNRVFEYSAEGELSERDYKKIWDLYDRAKQLHPALTNIIDYKKIIKTISDYVTSHKRVDFRNIDKKLKELSMEDNETSHYYAEEEWENLT